MDDVLRQACDRAFQYPSATLPRRHGPRGYSDYQHYKPWLRDEYAFRCVYCLWRERWEADGQHGFGVEHVHAQRADPERRLDYDNLVYACNLCNSTRRDVPLSLDPTKEALGHHVQLLGDGVMRASTAVGAETVDLCRLNRPLLVSARRRILNLIAVLGNSQAREAVEALREMLSFPPDLPNLSRLRPPEGNARPDGIAASFFERRKRGELGELQ
ncbi:MAG: HNH endonuclease [Gemmataceae bacterium]|nr:HNH endonuclease [Gemmataceae bacterium]